MVLNYIWVAFFAIAFVVAVFKTVITGDIDVWSAIMTSTFDSAKTAFEISLGLTGVLSLWMGIMKIGERGGVVETISRWLSPLFRCLFPDIPAGHPVMGNIFMSISANLLGLDNAATPLGLKAMQELQDLNPKKETASNPMIMYLVMTTSGLTLIPVSIMVYRAEMGAANPIDVFMPILLATLASTVVGIGVTAFWQHISLWKKPILIALAIIVTLIGIIGYAFATLPREIVEQWSTAIANILLFGIIISFILSGWRRKINVYDAFIEGAKGGFEVAVTIIPFLVAILVAIGVFRASGAMDMLMDGIRGALTACNLDAKTVDALPTAIMKPLSGGGARGMMVDAMTTHGADSFAGRLACIFQGSTDTTFYILAVYFGSVGITRMRHAVVCGLLADLAGIIAAIAVAYLYFNV